MTPNYYKLYRDSTYQWRWRFVAGSNGKTIADSGESYVSKSDAQHGIALMKASGNSPVIE